MHKARAAMICGALLLAACGGGGSSGGSTGLEVSNLKASQSTTSLAVPITFTVQCSAPPGASSGILYHWHYGDEADPAAITDTTTAPTATHAYTLPPGTPIANSYDTYQYTVSCEDTTQPAVLAQAPAQNIKVLREDLALSPQLCSSGAPGRGWCFQNPLPGSYALYAVSAASGQVAWAVGSFGTVLRTTDGGNSWVPLYLGAAAPSLPHLLLVHAQDADHAWVVAADGSMWSTQDGGNSWAHQSPATPLTLFAVASTDTTHAVGIDGTHNGPGVEVIYATSDGGSTWNALPSTSLAGSLLYALDAFDSQNLFVVGTTAQGLPFEADTFDGGATWSAPLVLATDLLPGTQPHFVAATRGSRCGHTDTAATQDTVWVAGFADATGPNAPAGVAYNFARGAASGGLERAGGMSLGAFDGRTAWMPVSGTATIKTTQDALQTLTPVPSPFAADATLTAFDSPDCRSGWFVGEEGEIGHTTDGAQSWTAQSSVNPFSPAFLAAAASSLTSAVALGITFDAQGIHPTYAVFATRDGMTWQQQHADPVSYVDAAYAPFIATDAAGDIVCGSELYLVTYVNGSWSANQVPDTILPTDPGYVSFVAASIAARSAWIVAGQLQGQPQQVLLDDLAVNAPYAALPASPIPPAGTYYIPRAIAAVDPQHAVLVGDTGVIQRVAYLDGTWQWSAASSGTQQSLRAVALGGAAGAATAGWAVGDAGTVLRTSDGGMTWSAQSVPAAAATLSLTSVATIDGQEGWIGGSLLLHTVDGGAHWTATDGNAAAVAAAGPYAAWAVGPGNSIQKTLTGGIAPR